MKRFLIFIFCLLIIFLSVKNVFAQLPSSTPVNNAYATAYQDYINKTGVYNSSHDNYLTARAAYLASGTLDSQSKAMTATLTMLQTRDALSISYLNAIEVKLQNTTGIPDVDRASLVSQINTEMGWYNSHSTKLTSAGSLSDLTNDSDDAKNQFTNSTQLIIYTSLITLGLGNNSFIRGELNNEITSLSAKISQIKANQDKDVSTIERSLVDVQNKIARSAGKDTDAKTVITSVKPSDNQISTIFQTSQTDLSDSNSYLKEANQGLLQIITQIKTAN